MRIVFTGSSTITVITAERLVRLGHEVIIIESDKERTDQLSDQLDCSFLQGDAAKPAILSQVDPKNCDFLFCLTDHDQINIITSLLGRSLGFKRVVTSIQDADLEKLCYELGLGDTIIPARTISRYLEDMVRGIEDIELSTLLKADVRFFTFTAGKEDEGTPASELGLPDGARIIFYYRNDEFYLADGTTTFRKGDQIVVITRSKNISDLRERWYPKNVNQTKSEQDSKKRKKSGR